MHLRVKELDIDIFISAPPGKGFPESLSLHHTPLPPYFITHKTKKFDYKFPEWITKSIRLSLKKRTKSTKKYHMNPTVGNKEASDIQSQKFTSLINE